MQKISTAMIHYDYLKKETRFPNLKISILFQIIITCIFSCTLEKDEFKNELYIDPGNIIDTLLPILIQDDKNKINRFENMLLDNTSDEFDMQEYFDIIFRYRDLNLLPIYYKIIRSDKIHPYFKCLSIYCIGEIGDKKDIVNLIDIWKKENNDLVREYIASAIGKFSDSTTILLLDQMHKKETNSFVRKTLEASIERSEGKRKIKISYLPLFDTTNFYRIKTFPSESPKSEFALIARKKIDISISQYIPLAKDCVFPHLQYKMCHSIYDKVKQPFRSFALRDVSHVGEDSGWLFEGMPVHSIMDGRVALIQHEEYWGCLVCIESLLSDFSTICTYYGHLSSNLDVYIGKNIKKGDKIGEIGPAFSFQNGGYRSHLHIGIEKTSIENALIAGYHENIGNWYSPIEFIRKYGSGNFSIKSLNENAGG